MLHSEVLNISFLHRHQIKTVFGEILGLEGIEHFSLDLVNPNGEMLFLSGTPQHCFEVCRRGLGQFDGIISPEYYRNYEFYWWNDAAHKGYAEQIRRIREGQLGLRHGFMLVRKWNNFYLIYSFATKRSDTHFQSEVINKLNYFLKMGDYVYTRMMEIYSDYSGIYEPPKIETFYPFEGGEPPARFTKNYKLATAQEILIPHEDNGKKILIVDFKRRDFILENK